MEGMAKVLLTPCACFDCKLVWLLSSPFALCFDCEAQGFVYELLYNSRPSCHCPTNLQSLLSEAVALLEGLEQAGAVRRQPARLQHKHASLIQFAGMMQQAADTEAS